MARHEVSKGVNHLREQIAKVEAAARCFADEKYLRSGE